MPSRRRPAWSLAITAALLFQLAAPSANAQVKHVMLLLGAPLSWPVSATAIEQMQTALSRRYPARGFVIPESVAPTSPDKPFSDRVEPWFRAKYAGQRMDALVAVTEPAVRFAYAARKELWPGAPVIAVTSQGSRGPREPLTTDLTIPSPATLGLDAALKLFPGVRRVAFVGGTGVSDRQLNAPYLEQLRAAGGSVDVVDLTGMPFSETQLRLATLDRASIVMVGSVLFDSDGRQFTLGDAVKALEPYSRAPMIAPNTGAFGQGIVGGPLIQFDVTAVEAAEITARVLGGESPDAIGQVRSQSVAYLYDWRQLKKWKIPEKRLPPGAIVKFRDSTMFDRYRAAIVAAGVTLLLQAALIAGLLIERRRRRRSQRLLADRLAFEKLTADISATLNGIDADRVNATLPAALEKIGRTLSADTASLTILKPKRNVRWLRWLSEDVPDDFDLPLERIPHLVKQAYALKPVILSDIRELPETASLDRETLAIAGIRSLLIVPIQLKDQVLGMLALSTFKRAYRWDVEVVARVNTLAEILCGTVARQEAEFAMRASEALKEAVMSSLSGYVVIANRDGTVLGMNAGFNQIRESWHPAVFPAVEVNASYPRAWSRGCYSNGDESQRVSQAVREVLSGERGSAITECRFRSGYGDHWLEIHAQRLERPEGGAVITHFDITARKRTELEAARNLGEISHLNRIGAMGEMAASLAHELNQPLAAIVANAEAGAYVLANSEPDLEEAKAALADIIEDGKRAGEVIRNMRALLRKGSAERLSIDLNTIAADTVRLVRHSALLARVQLRHELTPRVPQVTADPIQVQQVVLNLVANAIDALMTVPEERRRLVIRTVAMDSPAGVRLDVEDSGPGIPDSRRATVFQPFFTTKDNGLGVGLSVSRSIIESHHGRIWVDNRESGGAVFRFFLPADRDVDPIGLSAD
ncbi:MAG: GAF domain-containing protein [Acidobacteria bacterium]|nr:GAF domain-containing protein [Acidobacteriota bacterium]